MIKIQVRSERFIDNNPQVIGNLEQKEHCLRQGLFRTKRRILTYLMLGDIPQVRLLHFSRRLFVKFVWFIFMKLSSADDYIDLLNKWFSPFITLIHCIDASSQLEISSCTFIIDKYSGAIFLLKKMLKVVE